MCQNTFSHTFAQKKDASPSILFLTFYTFLEKIFFYTFPLHISVRFSFYTFPLHISIRISFYIFPLHISARISFYIFTLHISVRFSFYIFPTLTRLNNSPHFYSPYYHIEVPHSFNMLKNSHPHKHLLRK